MLSFDISDRQINVVKGDNSANKIRIEKSLVIEVPEDMILNGEVINLSGLNELITTNLKAELMMDKDAIVTFSSSNIVFKELIVPKAKGNEFLTMVQNHMSQEMGITDEYSISYTVVGEAGEDNPGAVKVLATACPSTVVESFRKLFNIMGVSLKSVNIGCNSISRIVLADKSNMEKMPLLVCQLDNNFLGLTLFENGQMAFARYVPISPEDYQSEDYLMEALNENIFRMEQFNKARGGSGLENIVLYGQIDDYIKIVDALDGLDIKASVLGVPSQITGFENFEFTVFANAIGALYKRNKATERINLLEVDSTQGKGGGGVSQTLITALIISGISAALIALGTIGFGIMENSVDDDIAEVNTQIDECDKKIAENKVLHNRLQIVQDYKTYVEQTNEDILTFPVLDEAKFNEIDTIADANNAKYNGIAYSIDDGTVILTDISVNSQAAVKELVDAFSASQYVADVLYSGYTGTGTSDDPVVISSLTLYLKGAGEE